METFYRRFPLYVICTRSLSRNFNGYFINFIAAEIIHGAPGALFNGRKKSREIINPKSGRVKKFRLFRIRARRA